MCNSIWGTIGDNHGKTIKYKIISFGNDIIELQRMTAKKPGTPGKHKPTLTELIQDVKTDIAEVKTQLDTIIRLNNLKTREFK